MTNEEIEAFYQLGNISRIMPDADPRKAQVNVAYSELKTKMIAHIYGANDDKLAPMTTSQAFSIISDGINQYIQKMKHPEDGQNELDDELIQSLNEALMVIKSNLSKDG